MRSRILPTGFILVGVAFWVGDTAGQAKTSPAPYLTGCRESPDEQTARREAAPAAGALGALPPTWRNIRHLPVVRCQLLASCGAYAPTYYYKTYQEARERGWIRPDPATHPERVMSPGFTFPLVNRGKNDGAGIAETLQLMCRYGCATWADMPESEVYWEYPSDDVWAKALPYRGDRVLSFDLATDDGLAALKAHLVSGDLAVMSIPLFHDVWADYPHGAATDNGVVYGPGALAWDNHAFTVLGYDDTRPYHDGVVARTGALLLVNSWGGGWGVQIAEAGSAGFCWVGYEYVKASRNPVYGGAYAMVDRINYVPRETAEIAIEHLRRNELRLYLSGGRRPEGELGLEAFPHRGGPYPYMGTITIDITDFLAADPLFYRLDGWDYGDAGAGFTADVPTIRRFVVHREGLDLPCPEVPVTFPHCPVLVDTPGVTLHAGLLQPGQAFFEGLDVQNLDAAWADVDCDGDADLAVCGRSVDSYFTDVYLNGGNGSFVRLQASLPSLDHRTLKWGDVDRDGYPDLLLSGLLPGGGAPATYLYRNLGGRAFVDAGWTLPGAWTGYAFGDLDRDGDLDLARSDGVVLRNDALAFVDSGLRLGTGSPGSHRTVSWVDVDLDGLPDLQVQKSLHRNQGDGTFAWLTDLGSHFTEYSRWIDFTGEGLPDMEAGGQWYRNLGWWWSSGIPDWGIPPQWRLNLWPEGYLVWDPAFVRKDAIDMDGDGDADYAITGSTSDTSAREDLTGRIYRKMADGSLADLGIDLAGVVDGDTSWCDWDGDGDADLLLLGHDGSGSTALDSFIPRVVAYENVLADADGARRPNQRPERPGGLHVVQTGGRIDLRWPAATDRETPGRALTYDVRVGTARGLGDVVSPPDAFADQGNAGWVGPNVFPPDPIPGTTFANTNGTPALRLQDLPDGRYFWSVRSVDGMRARSAWSAEQVFVLGSGVLRDGDVNGDGTIDVADLVRIAKMAGGQALPDPQRADLTGDGSVDETDELVLLQLLLDVGADGYVPILGGVLGPAGGMLAQAGFSLQIPAGALDADTAISLRATPLAAWFGAVTPPMMYEVEGLPSGLSADLTVRLPDPRASAADPPLVAFGQWSRGYDQTPASEPRWNYEILPAVASGGTLEVVIPAARILALNPPAAAAAAGRLPPAAAAAPARTGWTFHVGGMVRSPRAEGPHFTIYWSGVAPVKVAALADELEQAFQRFDSLGYPFVTARNWDTHPVEVHLRPIKEDGAEVHNSDDGAFIEINPPIMPDDTRRSATAGHEFFHVVQGLANPAPPREEHTDKQLELVNEAASTWAEKLSVSDANYVPMTYVQQRLLVFHGPAYPTGASAQWTGYAFSCLLEYYDRTFGPGTVRQIYTLLAAPRSALDALLDAPGQAGLPWLPGFYEALVRGEIYPARPLVVFSPNPRNYPEWPPREFHYRAVKASDVSGAVFALPVRGLGANGARFTFDPVFVPQLQDDSALVLSLENPDQDLSLRVVSATRQVDPRGVAPAETYGADPSRIRMRVPELKTLITVPADPRREAMRSFVALVVRNNRANATAWGSAKLRMGIARVLNGPRPVPGVDFTGTFGMLLNGRFHFPELVRAVATPGLTVTNLTGLETFHSQQTVFGNSPYADYRIWQDNTVRLSLTLTHAIAGLGPVDITQGGATFRIRFKRVQNLAYSRQRLLGDGVESQPYDFHLTPFSGAAGLELRQSDEPHATIRYYVSALCELEIGSPGPNGTVVNPVALPNQELQLFHVYLTRQ